MTDHCPVYYDLLAEWFIAVDEKAKAKKRNKFADVPEVQEAVNAFEDVDGRLKEHETTCQECQR